jgi:C4-dicarboxylate-specific signal transduction histidine kinase
MRFLFFRRRHINPGDLRMPKPRRQPAATDRRFRAAAPFPADHGTPERWQHSGRTLELTESAGILAARATEEHIVDTLVLRGLIAPVERDAALRFKLDYQSAALEARITARYSPASSARDFFAAIHERSEAEEAAYRRWRNALREVGKICANAVISTVCHDRMPGPLALPNLQTGLKRLVDWYGLDDKKTS